MKSSSIAAISNSVLSNPSYLFLRIFSVIIEYPPLRIPSSTKTTLLAPRISFATASEDSEYGLYIKTVNGITYDYETDGKYWAFYISDEYSMTGIDLTDIVSGETYVLKAE